MVDMLTESDLMNDLKALGSWLWSIVFDLALFGSVSGVLSFVASLLGCVYLYHRIIKIKIEVKETRINKKIKEIQLDKLIEETDKKLKKGGNITQ